MLYRYDLFNYQSFNKTFQQLLEGKIVDVMNYGNKCCHYDDHNEISYERQAGRNLAQ